jgi:hypothetical protein
MAVVAISIPPLSTTGSSHLGDRASFAAHVFDGPDRPAFARLDGGEAFAQGTVAPQMLR